MNVIPFNFDFVSNWYST